ncbi:MAG TPA: AI-2E family transporter [Candidatus Acidoferrales bacterium]|nr:AI-2E family transporter [Candidatus Acidoferrales bacterium]
MRSYRRRFLTVDFPPNPIYPSSCPQSILIEERNLNLPADTTQQKRLGAALFYGFVALLAYAAFKVFEPFLEPLCWAAVFVVVFDPLKVRLERPCGKSGSALACTAIVTLILIVPAISLAVAFIHQGIQAAAAVQLGINNRGFVWVERVWTWVVAHTPGQTPASLSDLAHRAIEATATFLASRVGTLLQHVAIFFFDLAVTILAMFYLFRDGHHLMARVRQLLPFDQSPKEEMLAKARSLIFASVTSSLVAAIVHGLFGGFAFAIVGIAAPVFWGVVIAFFSLLPAIGDWPIWIPAIIALLARRHWGSAVFLVIALILAGIVDNVLRPMFLSGRARLSGLVVFISVLGGIAVFGILGIILGPIVVATAVSVLDLYAEPPAHSHRSTS